MARMIRNGAMLAVLLSLGGAGAAVAQAAQTNANTTTLRRVVPMHGSAAATTKSALPASAAVSMGDIWTRVSNTARAKCETPGA